MTIPVFLGINTHQANKCSELYREIEQLQKTQAEIVEKNRQAAADVMELLSTAKLDNDAREKLGLVKMRPENVLLVNITEEKGHGW